jgi:alanyl-tRNA synthetase
MKPNKLRQLYLDFFKQRGHAEIPSSSLVPENDPTTLFTGSGMQPMVPYLLGKTHPKGKRIVDSQKCFRSQDIEEVGDNRHTTFFEMLGNWSLGDYFKEEQLGWFFEFLTQEVGLNPDRLFVTVFRGNEDLGVGRDVESVEIWKKLFDLVGIKALDIDNSEDKGLQDGRIFYYDETKNWWSRAGTPDKMPAGEPGGPDSEVFYDFDPSGQMHLESKFKDQVCHVNCDCGRFLEFGNSVFMQYQKQEDGSFTELSQKNVDFGGGFERILATQLHLSEGIDDVFMTPLFTPIIEHLEKLSQRKYNENEEVKRSFRVIADHVKAAVMLAADGVYPSNKEQGYFSRRLVRRAIRYAKIIGVDQNFIADLVPVVTEIYSEPYPLVHQQNTQIADILSKEEKKFEKTLQKGLKEVEKHENLTGELAFKLYETYGFPFELTQEIAMERGQDISHEDFNQAKTKHAQESKSASVDKFKGGLQDSSEQTTKYHTATHLLHAALRKILGEHVEQKGSNITVKRLRFDFSHPNALTEEEIQQVEDQVNEWIGQDLQVKVALMQKDEALKSGAIAFFVEKYPDEVTVYTVGTNPDGSKFGIDWISKEFCGGPHVKSTNEIGKLKIFKEKSAASGIRRVYLR